MAVTIETRALASTVRDALCEVLAFDPPAIEWFEADTSHAGQTRAATPNTIFLNAGLGRDSLIATTMHECAHALQYSGRAPGAGSEPFARQLEADALAVFEWNQPGYNLDELLCEGTYRAI